MFRGIVGANTEFYINSWHLKWISINNWKSLYRNCMGPSYTLRQMKKKVGMLFYALCRILAMNPGMLVLIKILKYSYEIKCCLLDWNSGVSLKCIIRSKGRKTFSLGFPGLKIYAWHSVLNWVSSSEHKIQFEYKRTTHVNAIWTHFFSRQFRLPLSFCPHHYFTQQPGGLEVESDSIYFPD